jgi:hypothetical protein
MKDKLLYLTIGLFFSSSIFIGTADAQIRLSFAGPNDPGPMAPVGSFDETTDTVLVICLPCLVKDGEYFIRFAAWHHEKNGYPDLPYTEGNGPTPDWRCLAFFEPGQVVVGYQHSGNSYPYHIVHGQTWGGYHPSEFTHLSVVLYYPDVSFDDHLYGWVRHISIPVVWTGDPVPVEHNTWGDIKTKLNTEGKQ